ncbi:peptidoglycan-binding domain-containing protein [Defluviimonas aestuarii]|uniref:peptidoglycan-binding domain-containing protein n=1 Tax=Albidovulum aestuarii TaxID=1130726 RepID=UPI00249BB3EB|nr:peptidoglycan-binding domain-containing protein [Defluviimonas aestuarii]MDI3338714.1 peptidoglycan-binding domain-containing protein [Defluviimonas aestuarii]
MGSKPFLLCTAFLVTSPVWAQDAALVIGNENYRNASDISAADDALDAAVALEEAGLVIRKGSDLATEAMRALLIEHYGDTTGPGGTVILLTGHFVHAAGETWFLGTEAQRPGLAGVDKTGLPLSTILALAAERPGNALVLLGTEDRRIDPGRGLTPGIGTLDIPQGVTVVSGDADDIAEFATEAVASRGPTLADLANRARGLHVDGYLGNVAPFLPLADAAGPPSPTGITTAAETDLTVERELWQATREIDTKLVYESYLRRYPDGIFADAARRAIAEADDPVAQARAAEDALRLSRDQRRQIQRDLSILDIDPRGIDGLFGPGSRNAIGTWQRRNGHAVTGYITAPQMAALAAQAETRAAELEAEAAARQAEQERLDRLYWDQTGAAGDEAGLRAYLKRYPDGLFAELAHERLKVYDDARREQAAAADRAAWDFAVRSNTPEAFRDYLNAYPQGAFAEEARLMLADQGRDAEEEAARQQAERTEQALGLNGVMRSLIEQRLAALGLKPGKADGVFDDDTRRALRRYQQARKLPVTGYLTQQTVARLLVDSF